MSQFSIASFMYSQVPAEETQHYEFKRTMPFKDLASKLREGVCGFANSGGGYFIAGVDGTGNADGGMPSKNKGQPIRDWIDQVLLEHEPRVEGVTFEYFQNADMRGTLNPDCGVLVVAVPPSNIPPHQVSDSGKYYARVGRHTAAASHYMVEALWARRQLSEPLSDLPLLRVSCEVDGMCNAEGKAISYFADAITQRSPLTSPLGDLLRLGADADLVDVRDLSV